MTKTSDIEICLTVEQISGFLTKGAAFVRREITSGRMRGTKVGGSYRVTREAYLQYLQDNVVDGPMECRRAKAATRA